MEFTSDDSDLHKSFNDDTLLTHSISPTTKRRKSSSAVTNGYIKSLEIPTSSSNLKINNNSASTESVQSEKQSSKVKLKQEKYQKIPGSVPRSTARLNTLGLAVNEAIKPKKSTEAAQYLEQSVDDDNSLAVVPMHKNDEIDGKSEGRYWFSKISRRQLLTLASLCLVDFTSSMCMSIMAPFFPMEAAAKGMDETVSGLVFSNYALVMFVSSPLFGRVLPYFGSHFLFFSGLFLAAGCTVLFGTLDKMSGLTFTIFCFVVRSLEALGAAAFNTAACTMVAQIFPDNVSTVFGLLETCVGLGMTLGPAVGGLLYSWQGFGLPFYMLGAFMIIMIPVNMWLLPTEQIPVMSTNTSSVIRLLSIPHVVIMLCVTIVQASAWSFLDPFLQPHLNENFQLSSSDVGLVFLMLSATYGIFCPVFGWVADRWGHTSILMIGGMLMTSASLLLIGPSDFLPFLPNELWLNMVALILMGIATPMAEIPTFESMIDCAVDSGLEDGIGTYSLVSGIWSAAFSFGEFVGPSLGGVLVTDYYFDGASTGIAGLILIPAVMLIVYETVLRFSTKEAKPAIMPQKTASVSTEVTPLLKSL